jgi:hypothetical protein
MRQEGADSDYLFVNRLQLPTFRSRSPRSLLHHIGRQEREKGIQAIGFACTLVEGRVHSFLRIFMGNLLGRFFASLCQCQPPIGNGTGTVC